MRVLVSSCARCTQPIKVAGARPRFNIPGVAVRIFSTKSTLRHDSPAATSRDAIPSKKEKKIKFDRLHRHADRLSKNGLRSTMTWIAQGDPALVKPEEIFPYIQKKHAGGKAQKVRTIVLLATPALSHFLDPERFLKPLIDAMWHDRGRYKGKDEFYHLNSITAVVDAIPVPRSADTKASPEIAEGLSLLLEGAPHATRTAEDDDYETPNIRFISRSSSTALSRPGRRVSRHVSLPVANTIFVNGQKSTLEEHDWSIKVTRLGVSNKQLSRHRRRYVRCQIQCEADRFLNGHIPLRTLTPEREIVRSMGNILAQIQIDGKAVPASKELEKAVPDYLASNPGVKQGPGLVYALIRPPDMLRAAEGELDATDGRTSALSLALWRGARLHKVTGGGGGWGKKQGLLSLDAAVDFNNTESWRPTMQFPNPDDDEPMPILRPTEDAIPLGSTVEFLVRTDAELFRAEAEAADPKELRAVQNTPSKPPPMKRKWVFGTASAPETQLSHTAYPSEESSRVLFFPNYFGMISFSGAALGSEETPGTDEVYTDDCPPFPTTRTMVDVPDMRLSLGL